MKKFIALLTALVLAMSLTTVAFAAGSPEGKKEHKVTYTHNIDGLESGNYEIIPDGETVELVAHEGYPGYAFVRWDIIGDYEVVSGDINGDSVVILPLGDIEIKSIFEEVEEDEPIEDEEPDEEEPDEEEPDEEDKGEVNDSDTSPETGHRSLVLLTGLFSVSLAAAFVSKKLAK